MSFKDFFKRYQYPISYSQAILGLPMGWYCVLKEFSEYQSLKEFSIVCMLVAMIPYSLIMFEDLRHPLRVFMFPIDFIRFIFRVRK